MLSPLRYPGGKAKLFPYFVQLISENNLFEKTYCEPYAGGAGLALKLLAHGYVQRIQLNDIDPAIAAFWRSVLNETDKFCAKIRSAEMSIEEWRRQRKIYAEGLSVGDLELGFSAYYLNRTSRSGIIEGSGPIGGYHQAGEWKINARFNRLAQERQVVDIARYAQNIDIYCEDALHFIASRISDSKYLTYLDPPYYVKGKKLYKNFYSRKDHCAIAASLRKYRSGTWILSYDLVQEILEIYSDFVPTIYSLNYSAGTVGKGREVIFSGEGITLPRIDGFLLAA